MNAISKKYALADAARDKLIYIDSHRYFPADTVNRNYISKSTIAALGYDFSRHVAGWRGPEMV